MPKPVDGFTVVTVRATEPLGPVAKPMTDWLVLPIVPLLFAAVKTGDQVAPVSLLT